MRCRDDSTEKNEILGPYCLIPESDARCDSDSGSTFNAFARPLQIVCFHLIGYEALHSEVRYMNAKRKF